MKTKKPPEVTARHLARKAMSYARQAGAERNEGCARHQRAQLRFARQYGWPEERIEYVDEGSRVSGTTLAKRPGFRRIMREVRTDHVGAIFVSDLPRLGRSAAEVLPFLGECREQDVLIVVDGHVAAPPGSDRLQQLQDALMSLST
jgi:DNA invertase Pin-like site-specific DNA recombinase